jgi:hypothetical protein
MIISHKHKFIFIKPQKTAGTSIELMLSRICGDKDIITPLGFDPDPNVREKHKAKPPQNYYRAKPLKNWKMSELFWFLIKWRKPNINYWEHIQADEIREYVGNDIWNSYLKISIVRNPWDHAVSWFKWQAKYGFEKTKKGEFENYLKNNYRTLWGFYSVNNLYDIDYMIRFECLDEDIFNLVKKFPELNNLAIPRTKKSDKKYLNYRDYFTNEEWIDWVSERSLNVIKKFKYEF